MSNDDRRERPTNPTGLKPAKPLAPGTRVALPPREPRIPDDQPPPSLQAKIEQTTREVREHAERREQRRDSPAGGMPIPHQEASPASVAPQVDQALGRAVRAIVARLWPIILAGGLGTGGAVAYQRTTTPPERVDAHGEQLSQLRQQVRDLQDEVTRLSARERAWQRWAVDQQDWQLQLLERQGMRVRRPDGSPPSTPIEVTEPLRKPGRVTRGPAAEVLTPPPSPP